MKSPYPFLLGLVFLLLAVFYLHLSIGNQFALPQQIFAALTQTTPSDYQQSVIVNQRLPRALIALYVGAVLACSGLIFQTLMRNPLANSSTLGVHAGAALFVVLGVVFFQLNIAAQGLAALLGGLFGFALCLSITRLVAPGSYVSSLMVILSGTLVSMLFIGISSAVLLGYPALRMEYLSWLAGNINHVYSDRLYRYCWLGLLCVAALFLLARSLTLIVLGHDKARSLGVSVGTITALAVVCAIVASSSAVAICGPIGFVGLVVPHIVRPIVGQNFAWSLVACALLGGAVIIIADICARTLFLPYILNTGVMLDFFGGIAFIGIIRAYYVRKAAAYAID